MGGDPNAPEWREPFGIHHGAEASFCPGITPSTRVLRLSLTGRWGFGGTFTLGSADISPCSSPTFTLDLWEASGGKNPTTRNWVKERSI